MTARTCAICGGPIIRRSGIDRLFGAPTVWVHVNSDDWLAQPHDAIEAHECPGAHSWRQHTDGSWSCVECGKRRDQ